MARTSPRQRRSRQLRRRLSKSNRFGKILSSKLGEANQLLLAVLAQHGGEVTITSGTIDQVVDNIATTSWAVVKGAAENEFIVRMVSTGLTEADKELTEGIVDAQ